MMKKKPFLRLLTVAIVLIFSGCGNVTETTNEIVIEIEGLTREYNYFLLNDIHLFIGDDEINPEYNDLVVSRINEFSYDGMTSAQNFDKWLSNLGHKYDGVILNADITDQLSEANLRHVSDVLKRVKVPYMYLQSDHDLATDWTVLSESNMAAIEDINNEMGFGYDFYVFEEDKFIILGINRSWTSITEATLSEITPYFAKEKPIIIISHVPYDSLVSTEIGDVSMELKGGRKLLWGYNEGDYYYPQPAMASFLGMVTAADSPVVAVIGAHLHTGLDTMLTDTIPEYLTGTGYSGVRTNLKIKAK